MNCPSRDFSAFGASIGTVETQTPASPSPLREGGSNASLEIVEVIADSSARAWCTLLLQSMPSLHSLRSMSSSTLVCTAVKRNSPKEADLFDWLQAECESRDAGSEASTGFGPVSASLLRGAPTLTFLLKNSRIGKDNQLKVHLLGRIKQSYSESRSFAVLARISRPSGAGGLKRLI